MESATGSQSIDTSFQMHERITTSIQSPVGKPNMHQTRRKLLILLTVMLSFSFLYLFFISFSCIAKNFSWLCQYYNHNYEFCWALISVAYDGLWLLSAYRYYHRILSCFAWLSTLFLIVFGVLLVIALLTALRTLMIIHIIPTHVLLASIISIITCVITAILQIIIIFLSFKLSKLICRQKDLTNSQT